MVLARVLPRFYGHFKEAHNGQGSEFSNCIIPIEKNKTLLDRSWLYTAVTRAKKKVILVGDIDTVKSTVIEVGNFYERRSVGLEL